MSAPSALLSGGRMEEHDAMGQAAVVFGLTDLQVFARGGQKVVCAATRGVDQVVLKLVLVRPGADPNALERCEREVSLLSSISSDNLVALESDLLLLGDPPGAVAWLEEFLSGQDLSSVLGTTLGQSEVLEMISGVGSGLAAMHRNGYVHRDLSPSNIRKTDAGIWKVMDPGFAKHLNRSSITGVWQPGTLGYLSPEHAVLGGRVTPASDVFCLGILAWNLLTGTVPIPVGTDLGDYRRRLLTTQVESIGVSRPDLSREFIHLIDQCLGRQPARRYLDAGEVTLESETILNGGQP